MISAVFMVPFYVQSLTTKIHIHTINTNFDAIKCSIVFISWATKEILKFLVTELDDMGWENSEW